MSGRHSAPWGGKSSAGQSTAQVVVGVPVTAGKLRTPEAENRFDFGGGPALGEQLTGDPQIHDAPIRRNIAFHNPPSLHPALVDFQSLYSGYGYRHHSLPPDACWRWKWRGGSQQCAGVAREAGHGVHHSHPGSPPTEQTPFGLLIGEASQPSQVAPIGTAQVSAVGVCQLSGDGGSHGGFQRSGAHANPSLEVAGAGLEHHTGLMSVGAHGFEDGRVGVVQIQQNVAGVAVGGEGLEVDVTSFAVPYAEEPHGGPLCQLSGRPKPLAGKGPSGAVVDQTDQIELARRGRHLALDRLPREEEAAIGHGDDSGPNWTRRTMDSQRTVSSVLTDCLTQGAHPRRFPR